MLATLAEFKAMLGITDASQDPVLTSSLVQANGLIAGYLGADLSDTSPRVYVGDRMAADFIMLPVYPVIEVVSLSLNGTLVPAPANGADGWWLQPDTGIINDVLGDRHVYSSPRRYGARATVTYRAGFTTIPEDLKTVCLNTATAIFNNGGAVPTGNAAGGTGELKSLTMFDAMSMSFDVGAARGTTVSGAEALLESWLFILKRYKLNEPALA